jgi:flagellar motor protein MotB
MAYLKIWKDGKLIKEKQIDDASARKGYKINLGSGKSLVLKTDEIKAIGSYEFEIVDKSCEQADYARANTFVETPETQSSNDEPAATNFTRQYCVLFAIFGITLVLLSGIALFFYLKMNQSNVKIKYTQKQLEVQKRQLTEKYLAAEEKVSENLITLQTKGIKKFTLSGNKLFRHGSVKVKPAAVKEIKNIAQQAKSNYANCEVLVIGYTDSKPLINPKTKRKFQDNWNLGAQRALAVMRILREQGVPGNKLSAISRGPFHLKQTEKESRRVEILFCPSVGTNIYEKSGDK